AASARPRRWALTRRRALARTRGRAGSRPRSRRRRGARPEPADRVGRRAEAWATRPAPLRTPQRPSPRTAAARSAARGRRAALPRAGTGPAWMLHAVIGAEVAEWHPRRRHRARPGGAPAHGAGAARRRALAPPPAHPGPLPAPGRRPRGDLTGRG